MQNLSYHFKKTSFAACALLLPFSAFAQEVVVTGCKRQIKNLKELFQFPVCIINRYVIPLLISIAIGLFIFGIVRYIANAENADARKKMKEFILWSLLAIFIILSVWAILYFFANSIPLGQ